MSRQLRPAAPSTWPAAPPELPDEPLPPAAGHDPSSLLPSGTRIDRYRIEAWIGDGGVASVYRVRHTTLETLHALKVLRFIRPDLLDRLLAEGRLQARLVHPHIVRVQDVIEVHGAPALLMDYVEGPSLAQRLREGMPPLEEIDQVFRDVVAAVAHAHAQGVVHRDLKPANVLLAREGDRFRPRVTDFGIARHLWGEEQAGWTRTGALLGTPDYMAPEQLRDHRQVSARADLFSLGVLLYELCCGRRPFTGPDLLSTLNALSQARYTPPSVVRPDLPTPLCTAIAACLVVRPEDRIPDCDALIDLLDGGRWPSSGTSSSPLSASKLPLPISALADREGARLDMPPNGARIGTPVDPGLEPLPGERTLDPTPIQGRIPEELTAPKLVTPRPRARSWVWLLPGALLILLLILAGLLTWRQSGRETLIQSRLEVEKLRIEAWRRADDRPAESIALLLAAAERARLAGTSRAGSPTAGIGTPATTGEEVVSLEELSRLARQGASSQVIPAGGQVLAVDASPDGSLIAAGLLGGELVVWDRDTGRERFRTPSGIGQHMSAVRFSPDGKMLVVVPEFGAHGPHRPTPVRGFDPQTGQMLYTFAHGEATSRFIFSPDGSRGVTGGWDRTIRIWNLATGSPERALELPTLSANPCLAISPDHRLLAVGNVSKRVYLFELATGRQMRTLVSPLSLDYCRLAFWPDGQGLSLGAQGGAVTWHLDGRLIASADDGSSGIFDVTPAGDRMLVSDRRPSVSIRSLPSLEPLSRLVSHSAGITAARFSPDGTLVTTAASDGVVASWETATGRPVRWHKGHSSRVLAIAQSTASDDALVVTGSRDRTVRLWSQGAVSDGLAPMVRLPGAKKDSFTLSADGVHYASLEPGNRMRLRQLPGKDGPAPSASDVLDLPEPIEGILTEMALSSDGALLAARTGHRLYVWRTGKEPALLLHLPAPDLIRWLEVSPDQRFVVGYGDDYLLHLLAPGTEKPVRKIQLPALSYRLAYTPDSRQLLVGTRGGHLIRIDLESAEIRQTWRVFDLGSTTPPLPGSEAAPATPESRLPADGRDPGVSALTLLADGREALVGGWHGRVSRWDLEAGRWKGDLIGHRDAVLSIEVSPDGTRAATASWDRTVRLWDLRTGTTLAVLPYGSSDPTRLSFSPDGALLATGARDGAVRLWDGRTGRLLAMRQAQATLVWLGFVAGSTRLRAVDVDGLIYDWELSGLGSLRDPLEIAARLTNLRLCPGTLEVVPVVPFPSPDQRLAPPEACRSLPAR